jgi:hypothetical protein
VALALADLEDPLDESAGSPLWWVRRLHGRILARRIGLRKVKRYYKGDFEWRYADRKLRKVFGHIFYETRFGVNWMKLIVSGVQERMQIDGIRVGNASESDDDAWALWQSANLDARSAKVHQIALLYGCSYVTVWPSDDPDQPDFKIDHPAFAAVEMDPDNELDRLAGLRTYIDVKGYLHAQLFLPDQAYFYVSPNPVGPTGAAAHEARETSSMTWMVDNLVIDNGTMENPFSVVPMVPFYNGPQSEWPGEADDRYLVERSELWPAMPIQDAINSVLLNTLLVANQQGFEQRWVTGLDVQYDDQGRPKPPFEEGITRLWQAEGTDTKFGGFQPTNPAPLSNFIDQLVRQLAAVSQIPPHYLEPQADRLSADSIRAAESGLISKLEHKQLLFGDPWEEVMRLAGLVTHNDDLAEANAAEMMWRDPETLTMAALYDASMKSVAIGIPWRARMEKLGYTPQQIERMEEERKEDAKLDAANPDVPTSATLQMKPPGPWETPVPATVPPSPNAPATQNQPVPVQPGAQSQ